MKESFEVAHGSSESNDAEAELEFHRESLAAMHVAEQHLQAVLDRYRDAYHAARIAADLPGDMSAEQRKQHAMTVQRYENIRDEREQILELIRKHEAGIVELAENMETHKPKIH